MNDIYVRKARIINVVDGDTVDMIVDLGYNVTIGRRFRLLGMDAPERNKDYEGWKASKAHLEKLIGDGQVIEQSVKADSFGRYLVTLFKDGVNLNEQMVTDGFAVHHG